MKTVKTLPDHYRELITLDLEKNKKSARYINLLSIAIMLMMVVVMNFIIPIMTLFNHVGVGGIILRILALLVLLVVYIILHELTHGVVMKLFGGKKVTYGFSGMYAFASCKEFFPKKAYLAIALAPVFVWGIALTVIGLLVPASWFWVFYIIQITNIAGAAGDYYVTCQFFFLPEDILVYDEGTSMTVYSRR